jgi:hypothetical protein
MAAVPRGQSGTEEPDDAAFMLLCSSFLWAMLGRCLQH